MKAGPPKPIPWPEGQDASIDSPDAERLTAPMAWQLYTAALGYHVPQALANAALFSQGLRFIK